ncbi:unnamed protein product [Brassica rapa]|uniref:RNase H type-1 domain-containing protein n=1 Tax=Brassica campestris TaxID=3711 RepID=A0A3P5YQ50_BRACM|nr:unnamed protein product [Brassica rapa]VDC61998.1 unnamed protein product [Brassica rapa]
MHRSDESPPLQRRRSFLFPLKQLCSLSMVLMVTSFLSRFRPPPDPPPWSLCMSRPFKARSHVVPPEPPDVPFLLAPPLQNVKSSVNPVVFLPRCSSPISAQFLFSARATVYLCRNLLSSRILNVVSTLAAEALTLQVALPSASSAGFSKLQVISDSIVLFSALHSWMDLNKIAGCLLTNLATLFCPLSFNFYQCTSLCLAVAIAMCVCSSDYVPLLLFFEI